MSNLLQALRADYCTAGCNPDRCLCSLLEEAADWIERLENEHRAAMWILKENTTTLTDVALERDKLRNQLVQAKAVQRAAFIAGYERFPGPAGCWDRAKISKRAAEEWEQYTLSLTDEKV